MTNQTPAQPAPSSTQATGASQRRRPAPAADPTAPVDRRPETLHLAVHHAHPVPAKEGKP